MKVIAPLDLRIHRPFRIADGPSEFGPRLGGRAPALPLFNVALPSVAEYFITFPLAIEPELYGSLYLNCSFDGLLEAQNDGFKTDDRILMLVHGQLARANHSSHESSISPHPLVIGPEAPDLVDDGAGVVVTSDHKIGGRPYCIQEPELAGADALFAQGFIQVLQLDFPGAQDGSVKGSWPFGGGLFNVFWKPPFMETPFHWCQQA